MTDGVTGQPWKDQEIGVVLDAYFDMLVRQLDGQDYVKAEIREGVEAQLPARSKKSVELKWCNVSAVLDEMGYRWVDGYKPLPNYQRKLRGSVTVWLEEYSAVLERFV